MTLALSCFLSCVSAQAFTAEIPEIHAEPLAVVSATQLSEFTASVTNADPAVTVDLGPAGIEKTPTVQSADEPAASANSGYSGGVFLRQAKAIPWRLGGATAAITLTGIANWNWGSSSFHFHREGWFGKDTASLGMDKFGHAFSSFVLTEFFTDGIEGSSTDRRYASVTAGLLAMGLMTYIEVFDGLSKDHGFSGEDLAVDTAGILFSIARRRIPGLREKVDFRLLYTPDDATFASLRCFPRPHCDRDGITARSPVTDYSNQRYLFAFKLAGFKPLDQTPLRLLEAHVGYYARGFTAEDEARGEPLRRRIFFGAGLNVGELLFPKRRGWFQKAARSGLEYLQVPYTAVHTN